MDVDGKAPLQLMRSHVYYARCSMMTRTSCWCDVHTPFIDDLLDGVVALLVGVGAHSLKGVGAGHIRAPIANIDEGPISCVDTHCTTDRAQVCI